MATGNCGRGRGIGECPNLRGRAVRSLFWSGLNRGEGADSDVFERGGALEGGDTEGLAGLYFGADVDFFVFDVGVDDFGVVDPGLEAFGFDAHADVVPLFVFEFEDLGSFVVGGVVVVEVGDAAQGAAPAADDEGGAGFADGEGEAAEEVEPSMRWASSSIS